MEQQSVTRQWADMFEDSFRSLCPDKLGAALLGLCSDREDDGLKSQPRSETKHD